ncbi:STAS domain-containing protein [Teredinibacter purpureus]|uniref:STAS domain-containing protein n=1 Tax=Teredinibacter purpureus TaxID=2731756 RepID=UPI0005F8580A|nr:STAS domain-containing protein [Teredinibacter purpureus]
MTINVANSSGGDAIITLDERFDFGAVDQFRKSYESLKGLSKKTLVIDFSGTRYMDSSALGMLINARSFFNGDDVKIKIINTNDQIKKIFSISRFDTKFDIS